MSKILIVDDDLSTLKHIKTLLTSFGYDSASLPNAGFLFKRLEPEPFDLILLDLNMPGVDGMQALQQLKEHPEYQKIPVIMLTGETNKQIMAECFEYGATDFVNKPINEVELKARVKTALAARSTTEQLEILVHQRTQELEISYSELERINKTFQLFVPKQFLQRILVQQFAKSGHFEEEHLTILFADIRSYTTHVESMTSEENFEFLNEFFGVIEPAISRNHGFVDKFIGDAIMALFDQETSGDQAIQAAIEMQEAVAIFNQIREQKGLPAIYFGIGINTGTAMLGALGSATRLNSTVIGDHVNLASRLETLTKKFNSRILISHHTYAAIDREAYHIREIDTVRVKGREKPVGVYEIFDCDPEPLKEKKENTKGLLFKGIALYKGLMFDRALEAFQAALDIFPQDVITLDYVKRCRYFQKYPPNVRKDEVWLGIVRDADQLIDRVIRRRSERYEVKVLVTIYPYGIEKAYPGIVQDISMSGMKIEMELPINAGDILLVEVTFKKNNPDDLSEADFHKILGRVTWSQPIISEDDNPLWMAGLETIVMTHQQEELLHEALQQYRKKDFLPEESHRIDENGICIVLFGFPSLPKNFNDFKKELDPILKTNKINGIIFNFKFMEMVNSTAIGILVSIYKTLQTSETPMALCELEPHCQKVFHEVHLDHIMKIYKTEKEAIASFDFTSP